MSYQLLELYNTRVKIFYERLTVYIASLLLFLFMSSLQDSLVIQLIGEEVRSMKIREHVTAYRMVIVPTLGEQQPWIVLLVVSTLLALTTRCCSREYSVGVSFTSLPAMVTRLDAKFTSKSPALKVDRVGPALAASE